MTRFLRFSFVPFGTSPTQNPLYPFARLLHFGFGGNSGFGSRNRFFSSQPKVVGSVGIFWDLDNKPPNSFPPFDAAIRLKKVAASFGIVQYMVAYANHHAFRYVPPVVREQRRERKALNQLENRRVIKPVEPYLCRVCGRKFYTNDKLINHFKEIHEREQMKRLSRLDSARGKKRIQLAATLSMKMEKYKNVAREILTPKIGYGLADELKRAGFQVHEVSNKPQAADDALRNRMVELMDLRQLECLVLVSDDYDFVDVLKEARLRCLKTVVVGDQNDGALKRCANSSFSWKEIIQGKAKKEAVTVLGRWNDHDILKRLEWTYKPEMEENKFNILESVFESEDAENKDNSFEACSDLLDEVDVQPWWKLDSDVDDIPAQPNK
ncbi:hypothetical protein Syun_030652 [Stephania yunnanensis]|uniref:C2H2-type domain-containing protein n=1 Tax=Stephania yunnanensis TaxID=152371 RepID=A0AAP0DUJ9_9MAGN